MNRLNGMIAAIESNDSMSLIDVAIKSVTVENATVENITFSAILLETPATAEYLRVGEKVTLLFKETEVSLAKNLTGDLSLRNRMPTQITEITFGQILSAITLNCMGHPLQSVITTRSAKRLNLTVGDAVEAMVKANEVALMAGHHAD